MATSGSKSIAVTSYDTLKFSWSTKSYSIENNTSTVSWKMQLIATEHGQIISSVSKDWSVTVNGEKYSGENKVAINNNKTITLASGETVIEHDEDGTKSFNYSFSQEFGITFSGESIGTKSGSGSGTLNTIPRAASIISAPNFVDGTNPTITYSNPAKNAVTSLSACISITGTDDIPYREIDTMGSTYKFELTDAEINTLRTAASNSNSIEVKFYVRTIIGSKTYYSKLTRSFSIGSADPIVSGTVRDINEKTIALTGNVTKIVKYYSNVQSTVSATAQKGATIDESLYVHRNGNDIADGKTAIFYNVESNVFEVSATDSRGNVGEAFAELAMVDYVKLTCDVANNRPDALGNMTVSCSGRFFNGSFGAVTNTLTVQFRYRKLGSSSYINSWTDMNVSTVGNSYDATYSFEIPNFNQQQSYSFEIRVADELDSITPPASSVKSTPIFHWGENDFVFEVPVEFKAGTSSDEFNVTGNLRLKGNENYGNTLFFGDAKYCYITEDSDDVMTIKATKINLTASSGVYLEGYAIPILVKGTWVPTLNSNAVSSYTTQYGWYSKMGQTVTVGFFIKANCNSGYDSTNIIISGLPYTPMFSAAGGGMCSGAYVSAGFNFQCYVAETNKSITTRVQTCNNTTNGNLNTSSSGCKYRSGGGELTLSGTITYMANS